MYINTITNIARNGRRRSYALLCYARMRTKMKQGEWFTRDDYYNFQDKKIDKSKIQDYTIRLAQAGLLERHPNKTLWRITTDGIKSIPQIERKIYEMNPHGNNTKEEALKERQRRLQQEETKILTELINKATTQKEKNKPCQNT
jgi:hypothetical protein